MFHFYFHILSFKKIYHKSDIFKTIHNLIQAPSCDWFPEKFPQGAIFILIHFGYAKLQNNKTPKLNIISLNIFKLTCYTS